MYQFSTADEALSIVKNGDRIYVHAAAAFPFRLAQALANRAHQLRDVEIYQLHIEGECPYAKDEMVGSFHVNCFFIGANCRHLVNSGLADFIPVFLSEVPLLIRKEIIPIDIALVHVSPPDKHGYCSLGVSVEATHAAVQKAKYVIAQVNPNMPRTHGDGLIHVSHFHAMVECTDPIPELISPPMNEVEMSIGKQIAELVEDQSTLQLGIGAIPNAVLSCLENHKDIGIHSEMISDGILPLVEKGVITGRYKRNHPDTLVTGFLLGSKKLYDFVDDNPFVRVLDIQYVNDSQIIRVNPKAVSVNSAIEVDITGQVCADSIGTTMYSGVGGQMDFMRGAALSEGGKPIIALPSISKSGISRISAMLKPGAGVVTTRAHVHYVVTEYGTAYLYGKGIQQRARALINIAHPMHREMLEKAAFERFKRIV